jgi:N-acetyl-anhydromuramyl-L-alanine amidase AmpD
MDVGAAEIRRWHKDKGWADIGYHFVIRRDGRVEPGRPTNQAGAHEQTRNKDSVAVCLVGGLSKTGGVEDNFTPAQKGSLSVLLKQLLKQFPGAKVSGHNHWEKSRGCPAFDWRAFCVAHKFPVAAV